MAEGLTGQNANIDFALAAMARACALPQDAPFALFALGRSTGWIAHALEQLSTGALIRPRARYVGPRTGRLSRRRLHAGPQRWTVKL